jgi:hypothetical protein
LDLEPLLRSPDRGKVLFDGALKEFASRFATARSMHIELERCDGGQRGSPRREGELLRKRGVGWAGAHGKDMDALVAGLYWGDSLP